MPILRFLSQTIKQRRYPSRRSSIASLTADNKTLTCKIPTRFTKIHHKEFLDEFEQIIIQEDTTSGAFAANQKMSDVPKAVEVEDDFNVRILEQVHIYSNTNDNLPSLEMICTVKHWTTCFSVSNRCVKLEVNSEHIFIQTVNGDSPF